MLPPYDSNATLAAIEALVDETGARELWCLGDSFHDGEGPFRLDAQARRRLLTLTARPDWTWITGNHDPLTAPPGGRVLDEASSEENTSELQSLLRTSYAVSCLKKKTNR